MGEIIAVQVLESIMNLLIHMHEKPYTVCYLYKILIYVGRAHLYGLYGRAALLKIFHKIILAINCNCNNKKVSGKALCCHTSKE